MRNKIASAILTLALCLTLLPAASASDSGSRTLRFEQIIAPQYEDAGRFSEGLAAVKRNGKWGYIDLNNNVVVNFVYDWANPFSEGYAVVGRHDVAQYDHIDPETGERTDDTLELTKLGRIDRAGNYAPFRNVQYYMESDVYELGDMTVYTKYFDFSGIPYYYNGWVSVSDRVFDTSGNQFKTEDDERYQATFAPTEGLVLASDLYEDGIVYLDMNGNVKITLPTYKYYDADWREVPEPDSNNWKDIRYGRWITRGFAFNQGLALVQEYTYDFQKGEDTYRMGFIDRNGNWAIKPQFDYYWIYDQLGECKSFCSAGLASMGRDGAHGAIDKTGATVIDFKYEDLQIFREGLAAFRKDGLFGYVDVAGSEVIPARYEATSGFHNGIAVAFDGTGAFLIDRHGDMIPGADAIDPGNYFGMHSDGAVWVHTPEEYVTIAQGGLFGFGKITYTPPLPAAGEMDSWAVGEVFAAIENGLIPATLQNMFKYNITRSDYSLLVVSAVCAMLGKDKDALVKERTGEDMTAWMRANPFSDTADSSVLAAYALGLVTGYTDGTFKPHNLITRQEAAVLLWRAAGILGLDNANPPASDFADRDKIPDWALKQVDFVRHAEIMTGTGENYFSPLGTYTRQQSYLTIWRLFKAYE
ncbi:MAG: WG repeat-containing protein [Oscillospiraceae bacterium]|nr:WG repeat-containing protein [Oscillospiraceae bacterium]